MDEEEAIIEDGEGSRIAEVAPALISVHPLEKFVAIAVGSDLRVFDFERDCSISLSDDSGGPSHSDSIRAICFGSKGRLFASAGDDKLVKIWTTNSWLCMQTVRAEKRVSAVAISHDGRFVTFADKFGVVWILDLDKDGENNTSVHKKAVPLLGHYCSIITSLEFSPDGQFIASSDRDFKIRITKFPKHPLKGAHEIQSFCLGHTEFVSCLAFACPVDHSNGFLLSGSGDSTVRLWDFISGCLLDTCEVGVRAGFSESNGFKKEDYPAVTDIRASLDGSLVVVAIQSLHGVMLLSCDFSAKALSIAKVVSMEENYVPTSLGWSSSSERAWTVMGASNISNLSPNQLPTRVRVISGFPKNTLDPSAGDLMVLEDAEVPGGAKLLSTLQGSLDAAKHELMLAATAAALKEAMHSLLIKKQYSVEKRELKKRSRNDRKHKQVEQ